MAPQVKIEEMRNTLRNKFYSHFSKEGEDTGISQRIKNFLKQPNLSNCLCHVFDFLTSGPCSVNY